MSGRDELAQALAALVGGEPPAGHPTEARLTAYAAGELEPDDAEAVQRHLAVCRRCTRLVVEASRFPDLEPVPGEPDAAATHEAWMALRARLIEDEVLPPAAVAPLHAVSPEPPAESPGGPAASQPVGGAADAPVHCAEAPRTRRESRRRGVLGPLSARPLSARPLLARPVVAWAVAAALALTVGGLGVWNARLAGRLAEPVGNVPILDLSLTVTRSSGGAPVEVPADAPRVMVLLLAPERLPAYPGYGAELVGPGGERLWRVTGLQPNEFDTFTVQVPTRRVPAGTSRLRLLGLAAPEGGAEEGGELLEEHELRKAG